MSFRAFSQTTSPYRRYMPNQMHPLISRIRILVAALPRNPTSSDAFTRRATSS